MVAVVVVVAVVVGYRPVCPDCLEFPDSGACRPGYPDSCGYCRLHRREFQDCGGYHRRLECPDSDAYCFPEFQDSGACFQECRDSGAYFQACLDSGACFLECPDYVVAVVAVACVVGEPDWDFACRSVEPRIMDNY